MNNCGCPEIPDYSLVEIRKDQVLSNKSNIVLPLPYSEEIDCLKNKVKREYLEILDKLECGIQPDLQNILEEISLIDLQGYPFNIKLFTYILDSPINPSNEEDITCFSEEFWNNYKGWKNSLGWGHNVH